MSVSQIEFIIKNATEDKIMIFLITYYFQKKSPLYPICIYAELVPNASLFNPPNKKFIDWQIAKLPLRKNGFRHKLARIIFRENPLKISVLFEFDELDRTKVEPLISHIQKRLTEEGYKFTDLTMVFSKKALIASRGSNR